MKKDLLIVAVVSVFLIVAITFSALAVLLLGTPS